MADVNSFFFFFTSIMEGAYFITPSGIEYIICGCGFHPLTQQFPVSNMNIKYFFPFFVFYIKIRKSQFMFTMHNKFFIASLFSH